MQLVRKKKVYACAEKKMGRPRAIATRPRMRDSLPVADVPCVRALRGSTGRDGVAAAFQRRHGRIVTAAQVIASNGPPCALLHPRRSPSLVGRAHGSRPCYAPRDASEPRGRDNGCALGSCASSAPHLARGRRALRPLVHPLGKPDGLSGRLPLCATWVEFRKSEL